MDNHLSTLDLFREIHDFNRKVWDNEIQHLHDLFLKTKNPMYVWQAIHISTPSNQTFELPPWCIKYLADVSHNLLKLSRNQDFQRDGLKWPELRPHVIEPEDAIKQIPLALGLSGQQGKSFFRDFNNRAAKGYEVSLYENLRKNGVSRREATDMLLRITNRQDERNLRRAFAESDVRLLSPGKRRKGKTSHPSLARAKRHKK